MHTCIYIYTRNDIYTYIVTTTTPAATFQHLSQGCQLVALPECFSFIGAQKGEAQQATESLEGPTMQRASNEGTKGGLEVATIRSMV